VRGNHQDTADLKTLAALLRSPDLGPDLGRLSDARYAAVIALSRRHGVEAWLASGVPSSSGRYLELAEQRMRFIGARVRARAVINAFADVVQPLGCGWVVLKGLAAAESLYPRQDMRHGVDVDVLVQPAVFADVVGALEGRGWRLLHRNWPQIETTVPGQLLLEAPAGGLLDLHWNVMDTPGLRRTFPLPTAGLLARAIELPSGTPALAAADQFVHLAVHGALAGANRLSWLLDCSLAAGGITDWRGVRTLSQQTMSTNTVQLVLSRAGAWFPAPADRGLRPSSADEHLWRMLCLGVDLLSPLRADPLSPSLARSFARSARPSTASSLAEFGRHASGFLRGRGRRARPTPPISDPAHPDSPMIDRPDPPARQRYFRSVSRAD
jgi:hypothetical protein